MPNEETPRVGSVKALAAIVVLALAVGPIAAAEAVANDGSSGKSPELGEEAAGATFSFSCVHILMEWPYLVIHDDECIPAP